MAQRRRHGNGTNRRGADFLTGQIVPFHATTITYASEKKQLPATKPMALQVHSHSQL